MVRLPNIYVKLCTKHAKEIMLTRDQKYAKHSLMDCVPPRTYASLHR